MPSSQHSPRRSDTPIATPGFFAEQDATSDRRWARVCAFAGSAFYSRCSCAVSASGTLAGCASSSVTLCPFKQSNEARNSASSLRWGACSVAFPQAVPGLVGGVEAPQDRANSSSSKNQRTDG